MVRILLALSLLTLAALLAPREAAADIRPAMRVAFLGDSLTLGLHASRPDLIYRQLLLDRIARDQPALDIKVVIQDPFGMTDDALMRLPAVLEYRPDLIFIEIGNHEAFAGGEEVELFEARYDELLSRLQETGATTVVSTLAWLGYSLGSREYQDSLRLNATIRRLAARRGIPVADVWSPTVWRPAYLSAPEDESFWEPYTGDSLHPNDAGHRALARAFWDAYQRDRARRALVDLGRQ